jgi:hypothetical protein
MSGWSLYSGVFFSRSSREIIGLIMTMLLYNGLIITLVVDNWHIAYPAYPSLTNQPPVFVCWPLVVFDGVDGWLFDSDVGGCDRDSWKSLFSIGCLKLYVCPACVLVLGSVDGIWLNLRSWSDPFPDFQRLREVVMWWQFGQSNVSVFVYVYKFCYKTSFMEIEERNFLKWLFQ